MIIGRKKGFILNSHIILMKRLDKFRIGLKDFLVSCFITYLLLALNNLFWNITDLSKYEWCFYDYCSTGILPIFYSIVMNLGDWITIIIGGILIPLIYRTLRTT